MTVRAVSTNQTLFVSTYPSNNGLKLINQTCWSLLIFSKIFVIVISFHDDITFINGTKNNATRVHLFILLNGVVCNEKLLFGMCRHKAEGEGKVA